MLAPAYKTATIRKLKRSHAELECHDAIPINPSRPILRSASVVRTKSLQPSVSEHLYKSYTDDQPNKLIFNRGKGQFQSKENKKKYGFLRVSEGIALESDGK